MAQYSMSLLLNHSALRTLTLWKYKYRRRLKPKNGKGSEGEGKRGEWVNKTGFECRSFSTLDCEECQEERIQKYMAVEEVHSSDHQICVYFIIHTFHSFIHFIHSFIVRLNTSGNHSTGNSRRCRFCFKIRRSISGPFFQEPARRWRGHRRCRRRR